jgi:hypothetical protein
VRSLDELQNVTQRAVQSFGNGEPFPHSGLKSKHCALGSPATFTVSGAILKDQEFACLGRQTKGKGAAARGTQNPLLNLVQFQRQDAIQLRPARRLKTPLSCRCDSG